MDSLLQAIECGNVANTKANIEEIERLKLTIQVVTRQRDFSEYTLKHVDAVLNSAKWALAATLAYVPHEEDCPTRRDVMDARRMIDEVRAIIAKPRP